MHRSDTHQPIGGAISFTENSEIVTSLLRGVVGSFREMTWETFAYKFVMSDLVKGMDFF
jgi:hypothetical protein